MPPKQKLQQQQQQQQQQKQQQQQQQPPPPQILPLPRRDTTFKKCDFCAKRRLRCDGLLPRCSTCTRMNKPDCDYRMKQPTRSKKKETTVVERRASIGTKRPVEPPQLTSGGDMVAPPRGRSKSGVTSVLSLKRCRFGASPATGLVGMQENDFLNDYFACLGFLPLASPSMVRQAMVKIMLSSMPQQRQEKVRVGEDGLAAGERARMLQQGEDGITSQTLASQEGTDYPSVCILWCTIALGALVQGCSSEFVTGYVNLARSSLAECFDGTNIETARAYLVMAFLQSFLGDQENNQKYLAFANSIVERLPQDTIPPCMEQMLLSEGDESRMFHYGCRGSGIGAKLKEKSAYSKQIPAAKAIMPEKDICSFFFLADRYWLEAFLEDMRSAGGSANITGGGGEPRDGGRYQTPIKVQEQGKFGMMERAGDWGGSGLGAPLRSRVLFEDALNRWGRWNPPPAGSAMKRCITDVLPALASLLTVIERSGTNSAVGSFAFHGGIAYMQAVNGDMHGCFESLKVCARVLMRFPGICRYRPHLVHAVLLASASRLCRNVYDPVRAIYNSILPWNGTPAPPMEEWGGMHCICNHVFCRSLHAGTTRNFTSSKLVLGGERAVAAPVPTAPSPSLQTY